MVCLWLVFCLIEGGEELVDVVDFFFVEGFGDMFY